MTSRFFKLRKATAGTNLLQVVLVMSITANPEAQDALFEKTAEHLPPNLTRAALRLEFPPSYVLVGVYRLFTDKNLYGPAWDKCKHATRRGAIVGGIWARFHLFQTASELIVICIP